MSEDPESADSAAPNQAPPLENYNLYSSDLALSAGVEQHGASWAVESLKSFGEVVGTSEIIALARAADRHPPELQTHDRQGNRRDIVEFHPAYHQLMTVGCSVGVHSSPWAEPRPGAQVARAAMYLLYGQVENGTQCPMTMTFAATPVL
ncbi:MAG: hypothetical protein WBO00_11290, partial [Steroidobacteraceae bacterium]